MMTVLGALKERSTCPRRMVSAVITDERGVILGTGYNGVPRGYPHCIDTPCPGKLNSVAGNSENCVAIHAEQNALINCSDISRAHTIWCTTMPCFICMKMILNTTIKRVIYQDSYPDARGYQLGKSLGRTILKYPEEIS
jgi:dCMP deaminase